MSNITITTDSRPWKNIGTSIQSGATSEQLLKKAGLDWTVNKKAIQVVGGRKIPNRWALVRDTDNEVLGVCGDDYKPTQNVDVIKFYEEYCSAGKMQMDFIGNMMGGRYVWALATINEGFSLPGGDEVKGYLLFNSPHVPGIALRIMFTPIRMVCQNSLTRAIAAATGSFSMSHRSIFEPEKAKAALGISKARLAEFKGQSTFLAKTQVTQEQLDEFIQKIFPSKDPDAQSRRGELVHEAFESSPGAEMSKGSFWSALNAVTYVVDHQLANSDDSRMLSAWTGWGARVKQKALSAALEMAAA